MAVDPHRLAQARSLAAHRLIAERIEHDPSLVTEAIARMRSWLAAGTLSHGYADAWIELLEGERGRLLAVLVDPGERATALRQCTPFVGVIDARTRWQLWAEVRERLETSEAS